MFQATESRMKAFEHLEGLLLPPEQHTVVRLELGDADTLFDDETLGLAGPLDGRFGKAMLKTAAYLVSENQESLLAYAAGDELAVLLDVESFLDRRSPRNVLSRFASMAAGKASVMFERPVRFDCRIYSLPTEEQAADFFGWRQRAYADWTLRTYAEQVMLANGADEGSASKIIKDLSAEEMQGILEDNDVDWDAIPTWRRLGAGIHWSPEDSNSADNVVPALVIDTDLPEGDAYRTYIERFLT